MSIKLLQKKKHGMYIKYDSYINDNILSLVICSEGFVDNINYDVYNIDINTGKSVSNRDLLLIKNISEDKYINILKTAHKNKFEELNLQGRASDEEFYLEQLNNTISKNNYGIDTPVFLDSKGNLNIIARIYSLAGSDFYYHLIDLSDSM